MNFENMALLQVENKKLSFWGGKIKKLTEMEMSQFVYSVPSAQLFSGDKSRNLA